MMELYLINCVIIISLGINPVRGGMPAKDIMHIANISVDSILVLNVINSDFTVFVFIMFNVVKIGIIIIVYIMKYVIQNVILLIHIIDIIHPMCPIDEYARSGRKCVWFIPITPPTRALVPASIDSSIVDFILLVAVINKINGANFCHVDSTMHLIHDKAAITDGYQKWHGAIPSLINMAIIITHFVNSWLIDWLSIDIPSSIIIDPRAWARKYLIDASVSWFDFVFMINGMNLNIFTSSMIHAISQFGLMATKIVLEIIKKYTENTNGVCPNIKIWRSWTPH